jgi:predicted Zn-dependent peptidase
MGLGATELQEAQGLAATSAIEALAGPEQRALAYAGALYSRREASYVDTFPDALMSVSAADVKRVASAYLKPGGFSVGMLQGSGAPKQAAPSTQ